MPCDQGRSAPPWQESGRAILGLLTAVFEYLVPSLFLLQSIDVYVGDSRYRARVQRRSSLPLVR